MYLVDLSNLWGDYRKKIHKLIDTLTRNNTEIL